MTAGEAGNGRLVEDRPVDREDGLILELYRQGQEVQRKYDYMLLAVAASAIALTVKRTTDLSWEPSTWLLAVAIVLWGFSFYAGCRRQDALEVGMHIQLRFMLARQSTSAGSASATQAQVDSKLAVQNSRAVRWRKTQFWALMLGAVVFLIWHVMGMTAEPTRPPVAPAMVESPPSAV